MNLKPVIESESIAQYEKGMSIPQKTSFRQFILCPVGLVGAGKTTVVKPLAEKLSLVRISTDETRKMFIEGGYNYTQENIITITKNLTEKYLSAGYSIAIDADCASHIEYIHTLLQKFNIQSVWIHINPPEEFIINKLKNYNHTWLFKNADEAIENYKRRKSLHENLTVPFMYTFDTSANNLTEQIEEAVKIILK